MLKPMAFHYTSHAQHHVHAFQHIRPHREPIHIRLHEKIPTAASTISDGLDRRAFLSATIATSCALSFVSLLPTTIESARAANSNDDTPDDPILLATTKPSSHERELAVSKPRPHRPRENKAAVPDVEPNPADVRFFVAGGASAALSHGITTPMDVVKTRMQSDAALSHVSPADAARKIVKEEGFQSLAVGLGPTVVGYGLEGALKFGVYESLKPVMFSLVGGDGGGAYLAAAVCAGALASVVLCPMEETRIRLVTDPTFADGFVNGLSRLWREEGFLVPFQRGMPPMLAKQVPYTMGKQVAFDIFAGILYSFLVGVSFVQQKEIAVEVEIGAAFLASIVACLMSHPGDVLLTATYNDSIGSNGIGFGSTIKKVYNHGGLSAFFRGIDARFFHVGCIITFQLVIYDQIKQALGLPASGS